MNSNEIRTAYLKFFEEKGHLVLPSSSLVPHGDPTLLLTTAGMVQIKPYFTGEMVPPNPRLASCQKCFRTTDIDSVGDAGHLTFFEMLGNFSVGDYFKKEAIAWAWELVIDRLHLPKDKLWITVFLDDDEAEQYWLKLGVPQERIVRLGEKSNFWGPAGQTGPCGPCSEIHYDFGKDKGCCKPECNPECSCGRFLEIWNLVFTQFNQDEQGKRHLLPKPNIDTGMGLERIATVMQGKSTVYETDIFRPIIEKVSALSGRKYGESESVTKAMRVVAEHSRAVTFLIADGVIPSNEGRGYVLRRVLRRAALFGRKLGLEEAFLTKMSKVVMDRMGGLYPELATGRDHILKVIEAEETRFDQTLNTGMNLLDEIVSTCKKKGAASISGAEAFKLYDTYGFPVEITMEVAAESGLSVDLEGFNKEMQAQRERAREAQKFGLADKSVQKFWESLDMPETEFVGYDLLSQKTKVLSLIIEGQSVQSAVKGQEVEVILAQTPFYGEMGGQLGDAGQITAPKGRIAVSDAKRPLDGLVMHVGKVEEGSISVGDSVEAKVDLERRLDIARNHTATHLLHAALRKVLGDQVRQGGSLVAPDYFRFDFTHLIALSKEELAQVQYLVNEHIRRNLPVSSCVTTFKKAAAEGALAFFGEKYGEEVRLVQIGDADSGERVSAELCGGTHLNSTGQIGFFHVTSEKSVGSGLRRIEAVTGRAAEKYTEQRFSALQNVADQLETNPSEVAQKVTALLAELSAERKRAKDMEGQLLRKTAEALLQDVKEIDGVKVLAARVSASDEDLLRQTGDFLKDKLGSGVIVLGAVLNGNPRFLAMVTPDMVKKGINAGKIVKQVAQVTGGGGGGRPEMAQAGGKDASKIDEALKLVPKLVAKG
ncbi:MAG: alanine--tRNA ligase [Dehalococcoidia bacterium]|nr:alanine--tRNA ligase [Dehalococcoidia bacterium]